MASWRVTSSFWGKSLWRVTSDEPFFVHSSWPVSRDEYHFCVEVVTNSSPADDASPPRSNFINFVSSLFLINYIFNNYVCLDIFSYIWIQFTFGYTEFVGLDILYLWTHFFLLLDTLNIWIFISINENIQISRNIQTSSMSKWQPPRRSVSFNKEFYFLFCTVLCA